MYTGLSGDVGSREQEDTNLGPVHITCQGLNFLDLEK